MPVQGEYGEHGKRDAPHEAQIVALCREEGQQENTEEGAVGVGGHGEGELDQVGV